MAYGGIGLAVAVAFLLVGFDRIDPAARGAAAGRRAHVARYGCRGMSTAYRPVLSNRTKRIHDAMLIAGAAACPVIALTLALMPAPDARSVSFPIYPVRAFGGCGPFCC
jgi:hypothetical protein